MDKDTLLIFLALVFGAVFLLTQSIVVPTFGTGRQESRRLKQRLGIIADEYQAEQQISLVRDKYFKKLSPLEKWLESLPAMKRLETFIQRSGHGFPGLPAGSVLCFAGAIGGLGGLDAEPPVVADPRRDFHSGRTAGHEVEVRSRQALRQIRGAIAGSAGCDDARLARRLSLQ